MIDKIVYQADKAGKFVGPVIADESPLEPGVFLIPSGATAIAPPSVNLGEYAVFKDGAWSIHTDDTAVDERPFSAVASAYLDNVRAIRESVLNRISGIGFAAMAAGDTVTTQAIVVARQALLDITKAPAVLAASDLDMLKATVLAEYRRIAAATPAGVQKAFAGVDL